MYRVTKERFWQRVAHSSECWLWTGPKVGRGYGKTHWNGKTARAHRVAWEITYGPIADGMCVLHKCDNPACCRPDHLFLGTYADNNRDMKKKGRTARGEQNGSYTHPESKPRGDKHYSRLRPEVLARGEKSGARLHPERIRRGTKHGMSKLTDAQVTEIRQQYVPRKVTAQELALKYGIARTTIQRIVYGQSWQHLLETEPK